MKRSARFAVVCVAALLLAAACATAGEHGVTTAGTAAPQPGVAAQAVTLGLFLPEGGPLAPTGAEVARGAAIAVRHANETDGIDGRPVRIVATASDRLWEGASGELVRLIYDEGAAAVIGALGGRSAHLAEQVITRARGAALFITPWASETTLTRIRVPWFFRMVPDDRQQAEVLAQEIFVTRGLQQVAVWVGDGFDGRSAAAEFRRIAPVGAAEEFSTAVLQRMQERIATGGIDAVVLFTEPQEAGDVVAALHAAGTIPPLFGPLGLTRPGFLDAIAAAGAATALIAPAEVASGRFEFEGKYVQEYGTLPTLPALYGHDAAMAAIEALRAAGTDSGDRLATTMSLRSFQGVTGEVRFNSQGGRDMMPVLAITGGGTPVARRGDAETTER